jgi:hypothetical protein
MDLFNSRADLTPDGSFESGVRLMVEALLQSPNFLMRIERSTEVKGGVIPLSGIELASRMSYALWNGPPDEALLSAGEQGALGTPDAVRAEASRLLQDPKARSLVRAYSQDYLGMVGAYAQFWTNTSRDPMLFPAFYQGIDVDFREEVLRFVDRVVFEKRGGYADLLTSPEAVVSDKIAAIYGLAQSTGSWTPVTLDPNQRPGLLTRAGFLGTHGRYSRGSLIYRGAFVLRRLLCQDLGSPPAGAANTPLPPASASLRTDRDRIQALTAGEPCASCHHTRINPAGFAMENFDGIGKFRATDNGVTVDASGSIMLDGQMKSFTNAQDYSALLAGSADAHQCFTNRFAQFVLQDSTVDLSCPSGGGLKDALASGASIQDFMVAFVSSPLFVNRSSTEAQ